MEQDDGLESAAAALLTKHTGTSGKPDPASDEQESQDQADDQQANDDPEGEEQVDPEAEDEAEEAEPEDEETPEPKKAKADETAVVTIKIGDAEREVTVGELKRGYLREQDYTRKTQEVAEARKTFVTQAQQYEGHFQTQLQEVGFLAQTLMQQLVEGDKATNWDELRQKNPAEFVARQHDKQQKQQLLGRAIQAFKEGQQRQSGLQQEQHQQHLAEESQKLLTVIPEWIDPAVRQTEQQKVAKFLLDMGVSEEEVSALSDAKTVAIARMAMLYKQGQSARAKAKQQLQKPVPPLQRSSGGVRDPNPNRTVSGKLMTQAKKSGRVEDFAESLASKYR